MSDYYRSEFRSAHETRPHRSLLSRMIDVVAMMVSVLTAVALVLTLVAPHVRPSGWFFPTLALMAPATYLLAVLLLLWWIIRWRWGRVALLLLPLLAASVYVPRFVKFDLRRDYGLRESGRGVLKIMSYNVQLFYGLDGHNSLDSVMRIVRTFDPDILCLQEFYPRTEDKTLAGFAMQLEGYTPVYGVADPEAMEVERLQQVIFSRLPVVASGAIESPDSVASTRTVWADLVAGSDTLRIFTNHLRSTQITAEDDAYLTGHGYLRDTARDDRIRSIIRRVRDNSVVRAAHADTLAGLVASSPHAVIVCGDFNDTPMSYTYQKLSHGLVDAFSRCGKGFSHTFRGFNNSLRIDYVLLSPGLEVISYEVPEGDCSDHHPVAVRFKPTNR